MVWQRDEEARDLGPATREADGGDGGRAALSTEGSGGADDGWPGAAAYGAGRLRGSGVRDPGSAWRRAADGRGATLPCAADLPGAGARPWLWGQLQGRGSASSTVVRHTEDPGVQARLGARLRLNPLGTNPSGSAAACCGAARPSGRSGTPAASAEAPTTKPPTTIRSWGASVEAAGGACGPPAADPRPSRGSRTQARHGARQHLIPLGTNPTGFRSGAFRRLCSRLSRRDSRGLPPPPLKPHDEAPHNH